MIPGLALAVEERGIDAYTFALQLLHRLGGFGVEVLERHIRARGPGGVDGEGFVEDVCDALLAAARMPGTCSYPWVKKMVQAKPQEAPADGSKKREQRDIDRVEETPTDAALAPKPLDRRARRKKAAQLESAEVPVEVEKPKAAEPAPTAVEDDFEDVDWPSTRLLLSDAILSHFGLDVGGTAAAAGYPFHSERGDVIAARERWMASYAEQSRSLATLSSSSSIGKGSNFGAVVDPFRAPDSLEYAIGVLFRELDSTHRDRVLWENLTAMWAAVSYRGMFAPDTLPTEPLPPMHATVTRTMKLNLRAYDQKQLASLSQTLSGKVAGPPPGEGGFESKTEAAVSCWARGLRRVVIGTTTKDLLLLDAQRGDTRTDILSYSKSHGDVMSLEFVDRHGGLLAVATSDSCLRFHAHINGAAPLVGASKFELEQHLKNKGPSAAVVAMKQYGTVQCCLHDDPANDMLMCGSASGVISMVRFSRADEVVKEMRERHRLERENDAKDGMSTSPSPRRSRSPSDDEDNPVLMRRNRGQGVDRQYDKMFDAYRRDGSSMRQKSATLRHYYHDHLAAQQLSVSLDFETLTTSNTSAVHAISVIPPRLVVAGCADGIVRTYDMDEPSTALRSVPLGCGRICSLAYGSAFGLMAVGGQANAPRIIIPDDPRCVPMVLIDSVKTHSDDVTFLHWMAGGPRLITGDRSGVVKLWDVRRLSCVDTLHTLGDVGLFHSDPESEQRGELRTLLAVGSEVYQRWVGPPALRVARPMVTVKAKRRSTSPVMFDSPLPTSNSPSPPPPPTTASANDFATPSQSGTTQVDLIPVPPPPVSTNPYEVVATCVANLPPPTAADPPVPIFIVVTSSDHVLGWCTATGALLLAAHIGDLLWEPLKSHRVTEALSGSVANGRGGIDTFVAFAFASGYLLCLKVAPIDGRVIVGLNPSISVPRVSLGFTLERHWARSPEQICKDVLTYAGLHSDDVAVRWSLRMTLPLLRLTSPQLLTTFGADEAPTFGVWSVPSPQPASTHPEDARRNMVVLQCGRSVVLDWATGGMVPRADTTYRPDAAVTADGPLSTTTMMLAALVPHTPLKAKEGPADPQNIGGDEEYITSVMNPEPVRAVAVLAASVRMQFPGRANGVMLTIPTTVAILGGAGWIDVVTVRAFPNDDYVLRIESDGTVKDDGRSSPTAATEPPSRAYPKGTLGMDASGRWLRRQRSRLHFLPDGASIDAISIIPEDLARTRSALVAAVDDRGGVHIISLPTAQTFATEAEEVHRRLLVWPPPVPVCLALITPMHPSKRLLTPRCLAVAFCAHHDLLYLFTENQATAFDLSELFALVFPASWRTRQYNPVVSVGSVADFVRSGARGTQEGHHGATPLKLLEVVTETRRTVPPAPTAVRSFDLPVPMMNSSRVCPSGVHGSTLRGYFFLIPCGDGSLRKLTLWGEPLMFGEDRPEPLLALSDVCRAVFAPWVVPRPDADATGGSLRSEASLAGPVPVKLTVIRRSAGGSRLDELVGKGAVPKDATEALTMQQAYEQACSYDPRVVEEDDDASSHWKHTLKQTSAPAQSYDSGLHVERVHLDLRPTEDDTPDAFKERRRGSERLLKQLTERSKYRGLQGFKAAANNARAALLTVKMFKVAVLDDHHTATNADDDLAPSRSSATGWEPVRSRNGGGLHAILSAHRLRQEMPSASITPNRVAKRKQSVVGILDAHQVSFADEGYGSQWSSDSDRDDPSSLAASRRASVGVHRMSRRRSEGSALGAAQSHRLPTAGLRSARRIIAATGESVDVPMSDTLDALVEMDDFETSDAASATFGSFGFGSATFAEFGAGSGMPKRPAVLTPSALDPAMPDPTLLEAISPSFVPLGHRDETPPTGGDDDDDDREFNEPSSRDRLDLVTKEKIRKVLLKPYRRAERVELDGVRTVREKKKIFSSPSLQRAMNHALQDINSKRAARLGVAALLDDHWRCLVVKGLWQPPAETPPLDPCPLLGVSHARLHFSEVKDLAASSTEGALDMAQSTQASPHRRNPIREAEGSHLDVQQYTEAEQTGQTRIMGSHPIDTSAEPHAGDAMPHTGSQRHIGPLAQRQIFPLSRRVQSVVKRPELEFVTPPVPLEEEEVSLCPPHVSTPLKRSTSERTSAVLRAMQSQAPRSGGASTPGLHGAHPSVMCKQRTRLAGLPPRPQSSHR